MCAWSLSLQKVSLCCRRETEESLLWPFCEDFSPLDSLMALSRLPAKSLPLPPRVAACSKTFSCHKKSQKGSSLLLTVLKTLVLPAVVCPRATASRWHLRLSSSLTRSGKEGAHFSCPANRAVLDGSVSSPSRRDLRLAVSDETEFGYSITPALLLAA